MIRSALDTDFYLITQQQASLHQHPEAMVRYKYKLRNPGIMLGIDVKQFCKYVTRYIGQFCDSTRYRPDELEYLSTIPFLKPDYIDFLEDFTFKKRYIKI